MKDTIFWERRDDKIGECGDVTCCFGADKNNSDLILSPVSLDVDTDPLIVA